MCTYIAKSLEQTLTVSCQKKGRKLWYAKVAKDTLERQENPFGSGFCLFCAMKLVGGVGVDIGWRPMLVEARLHSMNQG